MNHPNNTFREEEEKKLRESYNSFLIGFTSISRGVNPDDTETADFWIKEIHDSHKRLVEKLVGEIENAIAEPTELEDIKIYNTALKDAISIINQTLK